MVDSDRLRFEMGDGRSSFPILDGLAGKVRLALNNRAWLPLAWPTARLWDITYAVFVPRTNEEVRRWNIRENGIF